jgi:hypothetical protein
VVSGVPFTPVFGKLRPSTHRGNGSALQPKAGLSDGRLALVQQYMVDVEAAEGLTQAAAENDAAGAREEASAPAVRQQARPKAVEQERAGTKTNRRQAKARLTEPATTRPGADASAAEETLQRPPATTVTNGASRVVEATAKVNDVPDPREEARARKELVKADKLAAKQAARQMAALEKKEARERKALAKAAARRR